MGSPEAKGQPARPKGAVPARVGVFRHQRLSLHAPPPKKNRHTDILTEQTCVRAHMASLPRLVHGGTHTASHSDITWSPFAPVISHADTAFHICEGTLTQDFQPLGSGLFSSAAPTPFSSTAQVGTTWKGPPSGKAVAAAACLQIRPLTLVGRGVAAKPGELSPWGLKSTFPSSAAQTLILLFLHCWSGFEEVSAADLRVRGRDGRIPLIVKISKRWFLAQNSLLGTRYLDHLSRNAGFSESQTREVIPDCV